MKIKLTKVPALELKPGDLFVSPMTDEKGIQQMFKKELGVGVFVRTEQPLPRQDKDYDTVVKVEIQN